MVYPYKNELKRLLSTEPDRFEILEENKIAYQVFDRKTHRKMMVYKKPIAQSRLTSHICRDFKHSNIPGTCLASKRIAKILMHINGAYLMNLRYIFIYVSKSGLEQLAKDHNCDLATLPECMRSVGASHDTISAYWAKESVILVDYAALLNAVINSSIPTMDFYHQINLALIFCILKELRAMAVDCPFYLGEYLDPRDDEITKWAGKTLDRLLAYGEIP